MISSVHLTLTCNSPLFGPGSTQIVMTSPLSCVSNIDVHPLLQLPFSFFCSFYYWPLPPHLLLPTLNSQQLPPCPNLQLNPSPRTHRPHCLPPLPHQAHSHSLTKSPILNQTCATTHPTFITCHLLQLSLFGTP